VWVVELLESFIGDALFGPAGRRKSCGGMKTRRRT